MVIADDEQIAQAKLRELITSRIGKTEGEYLAERYSPNLPQGAVGLFAKTCKARYERGVLLMLPVITEQRE